MSSEKLFCPEFVYEIYVGLTVYDFVFKDLSLSMVAKQYGMGLSEHYKPVNEDEIVFQPKDILRFMSEQKNPKFEAHDKANFFVHYRLKFDGLKEESLKGFFSEMHCGDKNKKYSAEQVVKNFKAFTFALRAGTVDRAPPGWTIKSENKKT